MKVNAAKEECRRRLRASHQEPKSEQMNECSPRMIVMSRQSGGYARVDRPTDDLLLLFALIQRERFNLIRTRTLAVSVSVCSYPSRA
jgi:phosphoribosylpyrophosphate synthetase